MNFSSAMARDDCADWLPRKGIHIHVLLGCECPLVQFSHECTKGTTCMSRNCIESAFGKGLRKFIFVSVLPHLMHKVWDQQLEFSVFPFLHFTLTSQLGLQTVSTFFPLTVLLLQKQLLVLLGSAKRTRSWSCLRF